MSDLGPFEDPALVRRLVDDGMVLFLAIDSAGTITWIGRSSGSVLGAEPEDLVGTNALELIHPDDRSVVVDTLGESVRNADERILAVLRIRHAAGGWVTLEFGGIDLRDEQGDGPFLVWGRSYESAGRLIDFLGSLLEGETLEDLLQQVVRWTDGLAPYSQTVVLGRHEDGTYRAQAAGHLPWPLGPGLLLNAGTRGPWSAAIRSRQVEEADLTSVDPRLARAAEDAGLHAVWTVPIVRPERADEPPDGLLVSWRMRPGRLLATHRRHLENAAQLCRLAVTWADGREQLLRAATTDALTGIANRTQLQARAETDQPSLAALMFCDLDQFKELNDRHGHGLGDQVLRIVAGRLQRSLRRDDLLARIGGDEFAAWCPGLSDRHEAEAIATRMIAALDAPVVVDGEPHHVRCSIGIALVLPDPTRRVDADALLRRADEALYRAKQAGRGRWAWSDDPTPS